MTDTYTTANRLGVRIPTTGNVIRDFVAHMTASVGDLVGLTTGFLEGASLPAAGTSGRLFHLTTTDTWYLDNGSAWKTVTNTQIWVPHILNYDDQSSPPAGASIVGRISHTIPTGSSILLLGAKHICTTVGGTPSVFKIQTDHAVHGTLADVAGLTGLTPAAGSSFAKVLLGTPLLLANDDQTVIVATTPGSSLGVNVEPLFAYVS